MRQSRSTAEEIIRIIAESELPTASMGGWGTAARFTLTQSSHKMSLTFGGFSLAALS